MSPSCVRLGIVCTVCESVSVRHQVRERPGSLLNQEVITTQPVIHAVVWMSRFAHAEPQKPHLRDEIYTAALMHEWDLLPLAQSRLSRAP